MGATVTFTGTGATWNQASDWTSNPAFPQSTDDLLFSNGYATTLDNSFTVQSMSFDIGSGTASIDANASGTTGQTLTLNGDGVGNDALGHSGMLIDLSAATTGTVNIGVASGVGTTTVALGASGAFSVGNPSATLDFGANSVISGAFSLTAGGGTIILAGTNTFGGAGQSFSLTGNGTLDINNASALGNAANTFNINGGTIDNTSGSAITTSNYAQTWGGDFTFAGTNALNLGTGAVSLGSAVRTVTVNGTGANGTLTVGGVISGTGSLTKSGTGTLTLTGSSTYSGSTTINAGTVTFSGAGGSSGSGALNLGTSAGNQAVLNMNSSGTVTYGTTVIGGATTGAGAINQTSGILNLNSNYEEIGNGGYGSILLTNGTLNSGYGLRIGDNTGGLGVFTQTGGIVNMTNRYFVVGANSGTSPQGVATFTGGTFNGPTSGSYYIIIGNAGTATGTLNIGTSAGGNASFESRSSSGISLVNQGTATAYLNLNSGTIEFTAARGIYKSTASGSGSGYVNLNGGTLKASINNVTLMESNLTGVNMFNGGLTVNTQTYAATIAASLLSTSGNGIYTPGGTLSISSNGGSGYIGAPLVSVTGGSGTGAMAVANISNGVITGVTLTSPGQNFKVGDTLNFAFNGGGAATAASTFQYTLQAADLAVNNTGGLTKSGSGSLTLSGTNTYSGATTVSGGSLIVSGSISGSFTTVNSGGTLVGTGTTGAVTVNSGGSITAGASVGAIGTLKVGGNLNLNGTYTLTLNSTSSTTDDLNVTGSLTLGGGALTITDLGTGGGIGNLTIAQYTDNLTGTFGGLTEGALVDSGRYTIDYGQQIPGAVTLMAVPEPSSLTALLCGFGMLAGLQRCRRRN